VSFIGEGGIRFPKGRGSAGYGDDTIRILFKEQLKSDVVEIHYLNNLYHNIRFALHPIWTKTTYQKLSTNKIELPMLYDKSRAIGIIGFTPDRQRLATLTFITSPDDRK